MGLAGLNHLRPLGPGLSRIVWHLAVVRGHQGRRIVALWVRAPWRRWDV